MFDISTFDADGFDASGRITGNIVSTDILELPIDCILAGDVRNFKRWTAPFESAWLKIFRE